MQNSKKQNLKIALTLTLISAPIALLSCYFSGRCELFENIDYLFVFILIPFSVAILYLFFLIVFLKQPQLHIKNIILIIALHITINLIASSLLIILIHGGLIIFIFSTGALDGMLH